ncbi:glycosyltransferase family 2 protein [Thermomonas aquatica]|uniref:glycosyltransferase family 2 protein n=1 Tax=Thermomonas aquatica TaxID=2202149 RepID=UPI001F0F5F20|nr:glycosyltransferase family 2 protein [Thermomonas aquatica]
MNPAASSLRAANLPVVLVPVGVDEDALDACLAALDAGTPAGTRVWLADDAQAGPRGTAIIEAWLARTPLQAAHTRRASPIGEAAHIDEALRACGDGDVAILASDARPAPGWLQQLADCLARDAAIATATPWSNAGEAASWPRIGEIVALGEEASRLARACAQLPAQHPELPAAVGHAVLIRGSARKRAGGLDPSSYRSWYAALIDLSLRLSGLGWRNALCETGFVLRDAEGAPCDGDMDRLSVRWPAWHARLANFLMDDPIRALRGQLDARLAALDSGSPQQDLFARAP